jgi:excinuclease ABC subunit B
MSRDQKTDLIEQLTEQMHEAAKDLEFERAAALRDEVDRLRKMLK